jgi:acetyl esterase/lipase
MKVTLWISPRPVTLFLRRSFARNARVFGPKLMARAPADVVALIDQRYDAEPDALLDAYRPADEPARALPVVVWTHGGAFVGGTKDEIGGYLRMIAAEGFTVVGVRYSLAPEATYPTPARQVLAALGYLLREADRLHLDPDRIVLVGDSAGAHISAQLATIVTDPAYARTLDIPPTVRADQLRGVALCCGIFDLRAMNESSPFRFALDAVAWAYSGRRRYRDDHHFMDTMAVTDRVTGAFPPTFLTVGNADSLAPQSEALAARLEQLGVDVETLFYPADHQPPLPHEYQFDLETTEAQGALERLIAFLHRCTAA